MTTGTATVHLRPVVDRDEVADLVDVRELLIELVDGQGTVRVVEIGRKRLPDDDADSPNWGYVRAVADGDGDRSLVRALLDRDDGTRGEDGTDGPATTTVAARGDWELRASPTSTSLHLRLESTVGDDLAAQLGLAEEVVLGLSVKNPRAPGDRGLDDEERAELPAELQAVFGGNRWAPAEPIELLDHVGVEFVLVPQED